MRKHISNRVQPSMEPREPRIQFPVGTQSRKTRKFKAIVATVVVLSSGGAFAALYGFGPAEAWTIGQIADLTSEVGANIASFGATFSAQRQTNFEQQISAIAVATKQEALSATVIGDGNRNSAQQLVNAINVQQQSNQVTEAYLNHNPAMGQGFDPCGTGAKNQTVDMAFNNARTNAALLASSLDNSPGRLVSSQEKALAKRLSDHRNKFCTPTEDKNGLCSLSTLPGGDTNASLLFESAPANSLQKEARKAYMQHVLGEPDPRLDKSAGATAAGENYFVAKNKKDSLLSIPAYSMAMIDAANTQSDDYGGKSPNELIRIRVNQYFGGAEAEQWAGSMARQQPRGLLVEEAKMSGLETWLLYKQYEQSQRINANLAAIVLSAGERLQPGLDEQYKRAMTSGMTGAVGK